MESVNGGMGLILGYSGIATDIGFAYHKICYVSSNLKSYQKEMEKNDE